MSDELKVPNPEDDAIINAMESKLEVVQPATLESLKAVKYQDLKETFTVLGVPQAWKPGSKAVKMIADALEKLAVMRDLETKGLEGEQLAKAVEAKSIENDEAVKEKQAQEDQKAESKIEAEKEDYKQSVIKMNLSKEKLEDAVKNIDANLKVGIQAQRPILLKKRAVLIEILEDKE